MNLTAGELISIPPPFVSFRRRVQQLIPGIVTLKDFQWQLAVKLIHGKRIFLMLPCNSGKTMVWVSHAVFLMLDLQRKSESQAVTVVSAPMNQIIKGQMQLINSIPGMRAISYKDDPEGTKEAFTDETLAEYTVVFLNPHKSHGTDFETLIRNSKELRIRNMAFDEGGILTKWGAGDTFRRVLREQKKYLIAWYNACRQKMPFVLFTGAANPETCELLTGYFLDPEEHWDICIRRSPFTRMHIAFNVVVVPRRDHETRMVTKYVKEWAAANPPPDKILVLTEFTKNLESQGNSLLLGLNPNDAASVHENVVNVHAHISCVNRETDLGRYERGRGQNGSNNEGAQNIIPHDRGINPRTLCGTYGMLLAGWDCPGIGLGVGRGQTDSIEDIIQAMFRIARGLGNFGTFTCFASWVRRLEQKWRRIETQFKQGASDATIADAVRQMKMIDTLANILLYPDHRCFIQLFNEDIMGTVLESEVKSCQQCHPHDETRWCSSCIDKRSSQGVIQVSDCF